MSLPGYGSYIAIGEETTWGTPVTPTRFFPMNPSGDSGPAISREQIMTENMLDGAHDVLEFYQGSQKVGGSIELEFSHAGWPLMLAHVFGHKVTKSGTGPYTYTFAPPAIPDNIGKGLTIEVVRSLSAASVFTYEGCKINRFSLSQELNSIGKATIEFMGQKVSKTAATSPSFATMTPYSRIPTGQAVDLVSINAVSRACRGFSFTYENNYEMAHVGDDYEGSEPYRSAKSNATLDLTLEFEDFNEFDDYIAHTARAVVVTVRDNVNDEYSINFANAHMTSSPEPFVNSRGIISYTATYKGLVSGATREVVFNYKNSVDSAY